MRIDAIKILRQFGPFPRVGSSQDQNDTEARRTFESTFQSGVLRLIGGCDDSSVDMGRRLDVSLADVVWD